MAVKKAPKRNVEEEGWEDVEVDQFKFTDVGDQVEGILTKKGTSSFGTGSYTVALDDENSVSILGSVGLDQKLAGIPEGTLIRATLIELKPLPGGKTFKVYQVQRKTA